MSSDNIDETQMNSNPEAAEDSSSEDRQPQDKSVVKPAEKSDAASKPTAGKKTQIKLFAEDLLRALKKCAALLRKKKGSGPPSSIAGMSLILFACAVCVALLLGLVNQITAPIINEIMADETDTALHTVFPQAESFLLLDGAEAYNPPVAAVYAAVRGGVTEAYCVKASPMGFNGPIDMIVGVDAKSGSVLGVAIIGMAETKDVGSQIGGAGFLARFDGKGLPLLMKAAPPNNQNEVQAITGATVSSNAVANGVRAALETVRALIDADNEEN